MMDDNTQQVLTYEELITLYDLLNRWTEETEDDELHKYRLHMVLEDLHECITESYPYNV